jgi:serine/threonine-protein kinase
MSPEQLLSTKQVDHRADLWASGVVAYHALTGARPFTGETMAALSLAICHGDYAPPSERIADCPEALDTFFATALSVVLEDRFDSAAKLAASFTAAVAELAAPDEALELVDVPEPSVGGDPTDATPAPNISTLTGASTGAKTRKGRERPTARWVVAAAVLAAAGWLMLPGESASVVRTDITRVMVPRAAAPARVPAVADSASPPEESKATPPPQAQPEPVRAARRLNPPPRRPAYCAGDEGYARNEDGHVVPKPECL